MAVISVTPMWSRDGGTAAKDGKKIKQTLKSAYQVVHSVGDDIGTIVNASGLPRIGELYPGGLWASCINKSFTRVSPIMTIVECTFEGTLGTDKQNENGNEGDKSPVLAPPDISWTDQEVEEPCDEDIEGNPIVTVNGEPIEGITRPIVDIILNVRRNYLAFDPFATREYRMSVNSDTFAGFPAGTARLTKFSAKQVILENFNYWDISATVTFRQAFTTTDDKAWYKRVRHEGYYVKVGSSIIRAVDDNKEPVSKPVLLASDGTRETNPDNAHWLEFPVLKPLPYNALGLL